MYFDPLSAWLVALIADGIIVTEEKGNGGTSAEYNEKNIKQSNDIMNAQIRKIKDKYGLILAEEAYKQIQLQINVTKNSFSFQYSHGQIVIDLDNQEYIIDVLEECAKWYSKYESLEECRQKAEWYKNAAIEAKRRKELYAKRLEENRIKEAKEQEKQQTMSNIYLVIGLAIIFSFVVFFVISCLK